jgi:hypothetical protein
MDHLYATEVVVIITSPPERDLYSTPRIEQRIRQLLMLEMGDCKPSQFLRHLRSLDPDVPYDFLRSTWSSWLP